MVDDCYLRDRDPNVRGDHHSYQYQRQRSRFVASRARHRNDGDAITIAVTGSIVLTTGELLVNKSIAISGPRVGNLVVDGNASSRVFHIASDQSVSIAGLTVRNGIATTNDGGGIYNDHAALTLNDCTITDNVGGFGGGIYNDGSLHGSATLEINNCTINGNSATHTGGGIYNNGSSNGIASLTISSSTLSDNSARLGHLQ
jgi:hypothetical protein